MEVGRLPGVTDAEGRELEALAERLGVGPLRGGLGHQLPLRSAPTAEVLERLARAVLANPIVDRWASARSRPAFGDGRRPTVRRRTSSGGGGVTGSAGASDAGPPWPS